MSRSQTDKRIHTASDTRTPPELDFVVNRNKRRHTQHDAKRTIARTAPHLAPAPAAPPTPAPPRWETPLRIGYS